MRKQDRLLLTIDELKPLERNARVHSDFNLDTIAKSLARHGQVTPIVVDKDRRILKGNGTYAAAQKLGWNQLWAVEYEAAFARDGTVGNTDRLDYELIDNRSSELARWDFECLRDKFEELKAEGFDLSLLGWQDFEIEPIMLAEFKKAEVTGETFEGTAKLVTISVTEAQKEIIDRSVAAIRTDQAQPDMSEGRALELICGDFLSGVGK